MNGSNLTVPIDFDLHGMAGIRLLDANLHDRTTVARQLGLLQTNLRRDPDLIIRFLDHLPTSSPVSYIGVDEAGFTQDSFLVLRSVHKIPARVQIPFDQIGERCEIMCEHDLPAIPLLIPILNFFILNQGVLPLHASAFNYENHGILVTGWAKGGKTETLLAFMAKGAKYIGDEWIYLSSEPSRMLGIPEPIRLWMWHLSDMPGFRAKTSRQDRIKLSTINIMTHVLDWPANGSFRKSSFGKLAGRLNSILKRQQYVQIPPKNLFGQDSCSLQGALDKVFFVVSHETPDIHVEPVEPEQIAERVVHSLQAEYSDFYAFYQKFRFAFPAIRNKLIDQAEDLQCQTLTKVLAGKEAFIVHHPYPVHIPALYEALKPFCDRGG